MEKQSSQAAPRSTTNATPNRRTNKPTSRRPKTRAYVKPGGERASLVHTTDKPRTLAKESSPRPKRGAGRGRTGGQTKRRNNGGRQANTHRIRSGGDTSRLEGMASRKDQAVVIPPLASGDIRIVPVCGVEWVGTNMTLIEYKDEIIVIDAGIGFSTPSTPGIDYTIPNTTYLEQNKHKIKALVITHGHLDHVGAIPFIMDKIGNPPIYTREFGALFIKKRMEEFPHMPKLDIQVIDAAAGYTPISENLKVKFFGLTHSIPDSSGVIIQTPLGGIVSTGDVRVENKDGIPVDDELKQYGFFKDEKILLMTMDSTGIEKSGWTISEETVTHNVDRIIRETTTGRLFIAAFSSQVERLMSFMESAKKYGKYVVIEGRSMKSNLGIAEFLELTDFSHVIPIQEMDNYPPNKIIVIITGSQGEEYAGLNRMSNGTHKFLKLNDNDTIVLSSSVVPGNDYEVAQLKNRLYRGSYNIVTYTDDQVHASGHGAREELKWIHQQVPYQFFMPIHGEHYMLKMHAKMAELELNVPKGNIVVPDNGSIVEIRDDGKKLVRLDEKIPAEPRIVEGLKVKDKQDVVFRDRNALSEDGIFIVVVALDPKTGRVKKSPDIISRGFIYLRDNQELLQEVREMVSTVAERGARGMAQLDFEFLKQEIVDSVSKFLVRKTHKNPIVIPVVLGL